MKLKRIVGTMLMVILVLSLSACGAGKQNFPKRPIEMTIPFGAGGASDIFGRQYAKIVEKYTTQPITVVNKAAGGTVEGMTHVYNQPADGYSILEITPSLIISEVLGKSSIKFRENFEPLLRVQSDVVVIGVSAKKSPFKNIKSLIDFAKENPGKLKIAGISPGGLDDLIANAFAAKGGFKWTYVPYKSGSEIKAAVLGGEVDVYQDKLISFLPLVQSGDIIPLVVLNDKRLDSVPELKDVPSSKELGIDFTLGSWRGFCVKKGTPEEVKKYLIEIFEKAYKDPAYAEMEKKEMTNLRSGYLNAADFKKSWDEEYKLFEDIFKQTGVLK